MNKKILIALTLTAFIVSCGTTKLSRKEMSEVNSGRKSIVQTFNQPLVASMLLGEEPVTQIIAVDGKKLASEVFKLDEKIALDIGPHKVEFHCTRRSGYDERDYSEVIELDVKPYHEYLVRCSFDTDFGPGGTCTGSFSVKERRIR